MSRITEDKRIYQSRSEQEMRDALHDCIHGKMRMHIPPYEEDTDIVLSDAIYELVATRRLMVMLMQTGTWKASDGAESEATS